MKSNPIYCGLAFGGLTIDQERSVLPCCAVIPDRYEKNVNNLGELLEEKINNSRIRKLRKYLLKGSWDPACETCKTAEKLGSYSMRTTWNGAVPDAPMVEYIDPKNIKAITISLGRKCNSKCMTCNPGASTLWDDEWKFINPNSSIPDIPEVMIDDAFTIEILDLLPNIEHITFFGGEPLLIGEHISFLEMCVDRGISQNIDLNYTTNLTKLSDNLADLWKNFKGVSTSVSIDGVGIVNDYIRYPIKFSKVEKNLNDYLDLLDENTFFLTISCTISLFNINEFADLLDYYISLIIKKRVRKESITQKAGFFYSRVVEPKCLNSSLLSIEYRKRGIKKIQKVRERIKNLDFTLHPTLLQTCDLIESWCKEPQIFDEKLVREAIDFIMKSDQFRNHNIDDYLPGLLDELKSYLPDPSLIKHRKIFKINSLSIDRNKT